MKSSRKLRVMVYLSLLSFTLGFPSIASSTTYQFSFEGTVSWAWFAIRDGIPYEPLQFSVGQAANGFLYWNDQASPGYHYGGPQGDGFYSVGPRGSVGDLTSPVYWAEIYVGDIFFDLNRNAWLDIGIGNGEVRDSLYATRIHTSQFDYHNVTYIIDLPTMNLEGPGNIFSDSSYPSYLDLSLFDAGSISFQIYGPPATGIYYEAGIGIEINEIHAAPVPEPSTLLLLGSGLVGLIGFRERLKK